MPMAIPLIAAAVEVGGGVAAFAGATTMVGSIVAGLTIAGGALTAIGAVTGNKTLMAIGSIAGIAGGLTSLVSSASTGAADAASTVADAGSTAASTASDATSAASDAANAAADVGAPAGASDAAANAVATASPVTDGSANLAANTTDLGTAPPPIGSDSSGLVNSANGAGSGASDATQSAGLASPKSPIQPLVNGSSPTVDVSQDVSSPNFDQSSGVQTPGLGLGVQSPGLSTTDAQSLYSNTGYTGYPSGSPSFLSQVGSVLGNVGGAIQKNPGLANAAGGIVSGAMKSMSDQSLLQERYQQQLAYEQAQRDRYNASIAGLAVPTYVPPGASSVQMPTYTATPTPGAKP